MSAPSTDNPGVTIHPPLFYLSGLIIGAVLNRAKPWPIMENNWGRILGILIVIISVVVIRSGRRTMKAHNTNINPTKPTTTIITSGIYRYSRNPLYLSLTAIYIGLSLVINTGWSLFLLVPIVVIMHYMVITREERYLENKFGDTYRAYRSKVRRYL